MLTRRIFLSIGVAAAALAGTGGSMAMPDATAMKLRRVLHEHAAAGAVGRRYLAQHPGEADRQRLAAAVLRDASGDARALRQRLAEHRRTDYAEGDVVLVDGWVLARSEARLYALVAMLEAAA